MILVLITALFAFQFNILNFDEHQSTEKIIFSSWLASWNEASNEAYQLIKEQLHIVMPTWFVISRDDGLVNNINEVQLELLQDRSENSLLIPLVSNWNNGFDSGLLHDFLNNNSLINLFLDEWEDYSSQFYFDGINIDFEGLTPLDQDAFIDFLRSFKERFPTQYLTVDLPAKTSSLGSAWSAAYDYEEIGVVADKVMIMAYDYHWSTSEPGPITPLNWLNSIVNYTLSIVEKSKIVIGLPLYGYDWVDDGTGVPISSYEGEELKSKETATWSRDESSAEVRVVYVDDSGKKHVVYYQDFESFKEKIDVVTGRDVFQVTTWYLGLAPVEWFDQVDNIG